MFVLGEERVENAQCAFDVAVRDVLHARALLRQAGFFHQFERELHV